MNIVIQYKNTKNLKTNFDYIGAAQKIKMYSVSQKYFDDKAIAQDMPEIYNKYLKERSYKVIKVF